ncbi:hypothetical protein RTCIAT899_PB00995 (plasmid) [Rhizobium tropici CIAT 899]|nr:hypothetical protein RTCIAT899_PB00995 [Rhizobium tropici CIAT 899]
MHIASSHLRTLHDQSQLSGNVENVSKMLSAAAYLLPSDFRT